MAIEKITAAQLEARLGEGVPLLLDLYADWCGPCRMLSPLLEELATERTDVSFYRVNVDEEPALADRYGVSSIPTLLLFRGGELCRRSVGFCDREALLALLAE